MAEYVVVDREQLEADLTTVSDSIRGLIETEEKLGFPQGMKEAIESYSLDEPLEAQDALIKQIKTALQGKASGGGSHTEYQTSIGRMFFNAIFPEEYTLHFNIPNVATQGNAEYFVSGSNIYKIILEGNPNKISWSYAMAFNNCKSMVEVDFSNYNLVSSNSQYMFGNCSSLKKVIGEIDFSACTTVTGAFNGTTKLEEIYFVKNSINLSLNIPSERLIDKSIQSVIDGLADLIGLETQTLTLHKDVKAKLTEDQITTITSKNWTLA